jgi:hypothetical protein
VNKLPKALRAVPVAALLLVVAACGSGSSGGGSSGSPSATAAKPAHIEIRGGKPVGGVAKITVTKGQPVRFSVTSDVADEVHVHGYDLHKDVPKGGTVSFDFPAKLEGVYEAELESRKEQILSLRVYP